MGLQRQTHGVSPGGPLALTTPTDAYRAFYCDTAIQGNTPALMCAYEFFGVDHMVFATDSPYDDEYGARVYRETIPAVRAMSIPEPEKQQIFEGNARRLFKFDR